MSGVVAFDPVAFAVQFPAFATVPAATLTMYFSMAECYVDNTVASAVSDLARRQMLLYLVTAHIAFLMGRAASGDGSSAAVVGQMTSAGEGSVSASFAQSSAQNAQFWQQSQYGALYWQMALPWRTFRYFPAPRHVCG